MCFKGTLKVHICAFIFNCLHHEVIMSKSEQLFEDVMSDLDAQELELLKFESWYYSVIDDVASLIVTNGYNQVMKDIMDTVDRLQQKDVQ